MTTTEQTDHEWQVESHLTYLASPAGKLPTAEQIAGPIVRGLYELQRLGYHSEALQHLAEFGPDPDTHRGEAFDVEAMFTRACKIIVAAAVNHTAGVVARQLVDVAHETP